MKKEHELLKGMSELFGAPIQVFPATVKAVDTDNHTIDVEDSNEVELFNVRLKANIDTSAENVVGIPAVGSHVLVGLIGNSDKALYLVKATTLTQLSGQIGDTTFIITTDGIVLDGGENGPVFISSDLIDDINAIKSDLNDLKTVFSSWVVTPSDGGAALKTAAATWYASQLSDTELEDVTNERLTH